jgi:Fe-S cluster assembly scaffold protein SufB
VKPGARCRYTTIQNWSANVYNLVTKRAVAQAGVTMEWIDGNIGSKVTMKYPAVYLMGEHAKGETLSVAFAGSGQHQDAGAKMVHAAPNTSSQIVSKSVARGGGRTSYRGLVNVQEGAEHSKSTVKCDALLVDDVSRSDTYPYVDVREDDVEMGHEASVSKISEDQLFYLMSRGMTEDEAAATIVSKSVARGGGRTSYRGLVNVQEGAERSKSTVKCDALLVDTVSRSDTYPYNDIREDDVEMGHEASVSRISEDQLFYLMSRGMTEDEAAATIVRGFVEPIARELPMEYALELNRLIELQMEGAVG